MTRFSFFRLRLSALSARLSALRCTTAPAGTPAGCGFAQVVVHPPGKRDGYQHHNRQQYQHTTSAIPRFGGEVIMIIAARVQPDAFNLAPLRRMQGHAHRPGIACTDDQFSCQRVPS